MAQPTFEEFLSQAKPLNPGYSDEQIRAEYDKAFPASPPPTGAPALDEFIRQAKPLNPDYSDEQIRAEYEKVYGAPKAAPGFGESFVSGMKQGVQELGASAAGTIERLQAPGDPLKGLASDAAKSFEDAAQQYAPSETLQQQPWYERLRNPEYLSNLLGNVIVQSAPSLGGAVVGGVLGGPAGAAAGLVGVTYFQQAGQSYRESYQRHIDEGMPEKDAHEKAYTESGIAGLVSGVVNALAVPASLAAPFTSKLKNLALNYVANVAVDTGDQLTQNILAKATYAPEREITSGVPEAITGSALLSAPETMAAIKPFAPRPVVPPAPEKKPDKIAPILGATTTDEIVEKAKIAAEAQPISPTDLDTFIKQQADVGTEIGATRIAEQIVTDTEAQHAEDQKVLEHVLSLVGETSEVTYDEQGNSFYQGAPLDVVTKASLPDTLPPEEGLSKEKYDVLQAFVGTFFGKRIIFYEDRDVLPAGATLQKFYPSVIFASNKLQGTDFFSVIMHEAMHLTEGSALHQALRDVVWDLRTPQQKELAIARHGDLPHDALLDEVVADIAGTELHKPEVWEKVYRNLEERHGEATAKTEVLRFIDTLKDLISKIKNLIASRPWSTGFGKARKTIAEQYVTDLTKVHDALAAGVADAIYHRKGSKPDTGKLLLSKRTATQSAREIVHPDVAQRFTDLAKAQRGAPESAMLAVQKTMGGGVLPFVLEHTGDLIHRMTELSSYGMVNVGDVEEKVNKVLRTLTNAYGFEKEHNENLRNNARYFNKPVAELRAAVDKALLTYANEHRKLPVYNQPQYLAREASVALGEQRFDDAVRHLKALQKLVTSKEFSKAALATTREEKTGKIQAYQPEELKPVQQKKLQEEKPQALPSVGHPLKFSKKTILHESDREIAKLYDEAPLLEKSAKPAWEALRKETDRLYQQIVKKVKVIKVTGQPYADAASMNADIAKGSFKVTTDHSEHPVWTVEDNFKFRAVHDYLGHFETGLDFSLDGEKAAYKFHSNQLTNQLSKRALEVEVYGQAAAAVTHNGEFQPQKIFLPPHEEIFDYASTQIDLSAPIAKKVYAIGFQITDEDIAEKGREDDPHITVKYGLHSQDPTSARVLLEKENPIKATIGEIDFFETEDGDVMVLKLDSSDLMALNEKITKNLENTTERAYVPHITIAYVKPGLGKQYVTSLRNTLKGQIVSEKVISFSDKKGDKTPIRLGQKPKTVALEHYTRQEGLTEISPAFHGTGQIGAERRRMENEGTAYLPRTYFYRAGTRPEARFRGLTKYTANVPEHRLVDLATLTGTPTEREQAAKQAGYLGFYNSESSQPDAVALFESVSVTRPAARKADQPRFSRRQKGIIEKLAAALPETDVPFETHFLIPDGRRLTHPHDMANRSNHMALAQRAGLSVKEATAAGAIRYLPTLGIEISVTPTQKQAEILIDDWIGYNTTMQVDVVGPVGGVVLDTKEFDIPNEQIDATGLQNYVSRILDDIVDLGKDQPRFSPRIWFSQLANTLNEKMPANAMKEQVQNLLRSPGVKEDEVKWTGIQDYLDAQKGPINKHNLLKWLEAHDVEVQEVVKRTGIETLHPGGEREEANPVLPLHEFQRRWGLDPNQKSIPSADVVWENTDFPNLRIAETFNRFPNINRTNAFQVHRYQNGQDAGVLEADLETIDALGEGHTWSTLNDLVEQLYEKLIAEPDREARANAAELEAEEQNESTQYEGYKLPGGTDYTELLLTWPPKDIKERQDLNRRLNEISDAKKAGTVTPEMLAEEKRINKRREQIQDELGLDVGRYISPHWDEPNILAHVRFDTRQDGAGKNVLFIEEVQSDWHEAGREQGYKAEHEAKRKEFVDFLKTKGVYNVENMNAATLTNQGASPEMVQRFFDYIKTIKGVPVPDAPFSKSWPELVMKRMLRWASEHNYDRLAWTTGAQQNERYGLSKHVDELNIGIHGTEFFVEAIKNGRQIQTLKGLTTDGLANAVGKELAAKAIDDLNSEQFLTAHQLGGYKKYTGIDLEIGGSGMKYFYDQMLPRFMEKYLKRFGTKVDALQIQTENLWYGATPIEGDPTTQEELDALAKEKPFQMETVHSIRLTQEMKDSVINQGQPKFAPRSRPSTYVVEPPGTLDKIERVLRDKNVDIKRIVEAIQRSNRTVPEGLNPVLAEEMFQKRDEQRARDFTNDELRPLIDAMRLHKVSIAQLDEYLHARHVIDDNLNARLAAINPDLAQSPNFNKLSGLTDAEANAILNKANRPVLDALARQVDDIVETTRELMVKYGLEKQSTIDDWRQQYKHYVPLRREGFDEEGHPTGTGKSVRGSTVRERGGSGLAVENILANIAQARDQIVTRGEKNRVTTAMAGLMMLHPNPDLATLDKPAVVTYTNPLTGLTQTVPGNLANYQVPTIRRFNPVTGKMQTYPDPMYKGRDNVVNFRVNGEDYAIVFNEQNERAIEAAKAFKNLGTPQLTGIMKAVAPYTRYLAAINTQYNPIFGLVNFIRDAQFAMLTLGSTPLHGKQATVLKNAIGSLAGIYLDARNVRRGIQTSSPTARLWQRFEHVGGPTGYRDLFFTASERREELERLMDPTSWKGIRTPQQLGRRMEETALFKWLSDYNLTMENAIRLGVFKTAIDNGVSDLQAASYAKNITVNFNKKGQIGAQMGSLYAFFNANVQGTGRILETLFERTPTGFRISSWGKKVITGGVLLGILQTFALTMAGFDDDDPPEFVKQKNLVIHIPGTEKGYAMIPMPLGFNVLPNIGRLAAEAVVNGVRGRDIRPLEKGAALLGAIHNTMSPTGGTGGLIQEASPTVFDPFVSLKTNQDWTGKAIAKEDRSSLDPTPGHTRAHDTATFMAKAASKAINWLTGGTDYTPGVASPTPDQIDYLVQQATGGVGREVSKAVQLGQSLYTGEELPTHKIPLAGRFYGSATGSSAIRSRFYENVRRANLAYNEFEGRALHHEPFSEYIKTHPEARFAKAAITVQDDLGVLQKQKQMMLDKGAGRDAIRLQEERITNLMKRFNDLVERSRSTSLP